MHKKAVKKRKKLLNQIRHHRVLPDGRVLSADGRETLLGNLVPVKHIPMLPWKRVIAFPKAPSTITVATGGENSWFYRLLENSARMAHGLLGFTPVSHLNSASFAEIGVGSVGVAVQVLKIELAENEKALVHLKGVCRYENTGFLPSTEDCFCINVRWFEDVREADSIVRPQIDKCLDVFEKITQTLIGAGMRDCPETAKRDGYDFMAAQYLSFSLLEGAREWFSDEEKLEMLKLRSTGERFKKLNEYCEALLSEVEERFKAALHKKN